MAKSLSDYTLTHIHTHIILAGAEAHPPLELHWAADTTGMSDFCLRTAVSATY